MHYGHALTLSPPQKKHVFTCSQHRSFENTVGKGEIARNEQFLLFPQCFQPIRRTFCNFHQIQNCRLQSLSVWESLKIVVWEGVKFPFSRAWPFLIENSYFHYKTILQNQRKLKMSIIEPLSPIHFPISSFLELTSINLKSLSSQYEGR